MLVNLCGFNSPDSLVTEPPSITLVQAFLKGCLQLLRAGNDCSNTLAGLLGLQKGQSVPTRDRPVVEHHSYVAQQGEDEKVPCFLILEPRNVTNNYQQQVPVGAMNGGKGSGERVSTSPRLIS